MTAFDSRKRIDFKLRLAAFIGLGVAGSDIQVNMATQNRRKLKLVNRRMLSGQAITVNIEVSMPNITAAAHAVQIIGEADVSTLSSELGVTVNAMTSAPRLIRRPIGIGQANLNSADAPFAPSPGFVAGIAGAGLASFALLAYGGWRARRRRADRSGETESRLESVTRDGALPDPRNLPAPSVDNEASWEWPSASLEWGKRLGRGSFGSVYVVESSGLKLAAKRMSLVEDEEKDATKKMMRREALAMRSLNHPNVVQIYGVVLDHPEYVALLMELAGFGSLRDVMDSEPDLIMSRPDVQLQLALHVAQGMQCLHAQDPPMLHHDLKTANVLLFAADGGAHAKSPWARLRGQIDEGSVGHLQAKLCDFGLAKGLQVGTGAMTLQSSRATGGPGGTLAYTAPEAFDDDYLMASEVYSFAIILWELMTCQIPWSINPETGKPYTVKALIKAVCLDDKRPELPSHLVGTVLGGLAERCWRSSANSRPTISQVCQTLQLAIRQAAEVSSDGFPVDHVVSVLDDGESEDKFNASERKLAFTLRAGGIHRSHKADSNEAMKSFGPRKLRMASHESTGTDLAPTTVESEPTLPAEGNSASMPQMPRPAPLPAPGLSQRFGTASKKQRAAFAAQVNSRSVEPHLPIPEQTAAPDLENESETVVLSESMQANEPSTATSSGDETGRRDATTIADDGEYVDGFNPPPSNPVVFEDDDEPNFEDPISPRLPTTAEADEEPIILMPIARPEGVNRTKSVGTVVGAVEFSDDDDQYLEV